MIDLVFEFEIMYNMYIERSIVLFVREIYLFSYSFFFHIRFLSFFISFSMIDSFNSWNNVNEYERNQSMAFNRQIEILDCRIHRRHRQ